MSEGLRVVAGTEADFAAYVAERRPALLRWATVVAGDPHTAEDLVQASLVRVLPGGRASGSRPRPTPTCAGRWPTST